MIGDILRPQRANALFKGGDDIQLNACVGENGGPYDMSDYGEGFFLGAEALVAACETHYAVDVLIYPIASCYRQGIELYLKELLRLARRLTGSIEEVKKNHQIQDLWKSFLAETKEVPTWSVGESELHEAGEMIDAFCEMDRFGQTFRYPEDKKGQAHLADMRLINVGILGEHMRRLHESLSDWYGYLACIEADRQEYELLAREEMGEV